MATFDIPQAPLRHRRGVSHQLCAAAQAIRGVDGALIGRELLARATRSVESAAAALAQMRDPLDWLMLDSFMLGEAGRLAIREPHTAHLYVNVSISTLEHRRLRANYLQALDMYAAVNGARRLVVEIHEHLDWPVADIDALIDAIHARGALVAMDDFAATPECRRKAAAHWDVIKVDCRAAGSERACEALDALTATTPFLVAEAVETAAQREAVFAVGADAVQGFVDGPPQRVEQIAPSATKGADPDPER